MPDLNKIIFRRPNDLPAVKFMRSDVPRAAVPAARGKYYESLAPDTLNVEERARLFVERYLCNIVAPELMYEPFNRGCFDVDPPRLSLDSGSYLCAWAKYRESLPLMRLMCGSDAGLEIDSAWARHILMCIGDDGLFYVPLVGRPYESIKAYPWLSLENAEFYTNLFIGQGRLLGALSIYYAMTGDETWNRTARAIVDRLNQLAIRMDGVAFFPQFYYTPGVRVSEMQIRKSISEWERLKAKGRSSEFAGATQGEIEENTALWQTWIAVGLAQYYKVSHYEPARELAYGIVNYLRRVRYVEDWSSHTHCVTLGIHAMLELAQATGDVELAEYARKSYEFAKSGERMVALPRIGYFVNFTTPEGAEGCTIGDMTALAVKLAQMGMGDQYWEDVDRYARNCLTEIQRTTPEHAAGVFEKLREREKPPETPVAYYELADQLAERMVGSFSSHYYPNDLFASTYFDSCCSGNCSRALYYVWESIVRRDNGRLKVNLLLNRTSPWADIDSHVPHAGRVDIKIKKPVGSLQVRMNDWIEKDKVKCAVNGRPLPYTWQGAYLTTGPLKPRDEIVLSFPIRERSETLESFGFRFDTVFRGNDCMSMEPKGEFYALYQRDHYRQPVRFVKVKRFASENAVDY
ncbi:MAG: hypothetical protein Q7T82_19960 [Armatimonadota bacterium]|nr:hypothetical protein [Armatimonadota bacterium]